ncbi:isocitrate lyase/PEP mutase family protein [Shimazuella alba]|nr:isocitrate lyase/phosphoenolpyruvate mutase family protein [Shimazuella alba]
MENHMLKNATFRNLHSDFFILPNAWDAISAKILEECGFKAIGTTSAGIAASSGYQDRKIPFQTAIATIEQIIKAVDVPVTVDMEDGYGESIQEILQNVRQMILIGATGINLEDSTMDSKDPLYDISVQQKKIAAIKELCIKEGIPIFLNACTDLYWCNIGDPSLRIHKMIKRAKAYEKAGADGIFVPGISSIEEIQLLRSEVSCPINLLAAANTPSISKLKEIGIQRVSCGSAPFRATMTFLKNAGEQLLNHGNFLPITSDVLSYQEVDHLFSVRKET